MTSSIQEILETNLENNSLNDQVLSRKEKLNQLKIRKLNPNLSSQSNKKEKIIMKFRNYDPIHQIPKRDQQQQKKNNNNSIENDETVEETVKDLIEKVKKNDLIIQSSELDLTKIQPKKINWDLKRDLMKKLSKLEPITQSAFATLIRKRMQAENGTVTDETAFALVKEMNTDRILNEEKSDESSDE